MKFRLMSDLHLEFEGPTIKFFPVHLEDDKDTVLILAGDVHLGTNAKPFLKRMARRFAHVIYIFGNHEFYNHNYGVLQETWARMPDLPGNVSVLNDDEKIFDGVRILGGTLWTDFDNDDWFAKQRAKQSMNDYDLIHIAETNPVSPYSKKVRRFLPDDSVRAHNITKVFFAEKLREPFDGKTVIVSHHLPHPLCVPQTFKNSPLNPAYVSNLDSMLEEFDIAVWCHGHTHSNVDETVHGTRILCNPRGYVPDALNPHFIKDLTFEV